MVRSSMFLGIFFMLLTTVSTVVYHKTPLKGEVCTTTKTVPKEITYKQKKTITETYKTTCGVFYWDRCTRNRDVVKVFVVKETKYVDQKLYYCCKGWQIDPKYPDTCSIHGIAPIVLKCPRKQTVFRHSSVDYVSWTPPVFKEAYLKPLSVKVPYQGNSGVLEWGLNRMSYTATSLNNKMTSECIVEVDVKPHPTTVIITDRKLGEKIIQVSGEELTLSCTARYYSGQDKLTWSMSTGLDDSKITFDQKPSDIDKFNHIFSTIQINVKKKHVQSKIECRLGKTNQAFHVFLDVTYEVRPKVDFCDKNMTYERSTRLSFVSWKTAKFIDPRHNEKVDVFSNFGDGVISQKLAWGEHEIVYIGTNRRNRLTAMCKFNIVLMPKQCRRDVIMPQNGGLVCGYWGKHYLQACYPVCADRKSNMWSGQYSHLLTCSANGVWTPEAKKINCNEVVKENDPSKLKKEDFHGSCSKPAIDKQKSLFITQKMQGSEFNKLCGKVTGDYKVDVKLYCH